MTENIIKLNREDLKDLKEKGYITRERFSDVSKMVRWKPKHKEAYFTFNVDGYITIKSWGDGDTDKRRYQIGHVFDTYKKAKKELDRRIAEQELLDMCDWEYGNLYFIVYNYREKVFDTHFTSCSMVPTPYRFATYESAQKAVGTLGTERLKLMFRID